MCGLKLHGQRPEKVMEAKGLEKVHKRKLCSNVSLSISQDFHSNLATVLTHQVQFKYFVDISLFQKSKWIFLVIKVV